MSNDYDHDKLYNVLLYAQRGLVEMGELHARVLAYARPIVAEECAVIVESKASALLGQSYSSTSMEIMRRALLDVSKAFATAIREHGKEKP